MSASGEPANQDLPTLDNIPENATRMTTLEEVLHSKLLSPADTIQFYDGYSEKYDEDMDGELKGYECVMQALTKHVNDKSVHILDCCCGTGYGGRLLKEHGFTNVDGIDGSQAMLSKAVEKGLYNKVFCEFVEPKPLAAIRPKTYDVLVTSGSFAGGHMSAQCVPFLVGLVKSGGYFIASMRKEFVETVPSLHGMLEEIALLDTNKVAMTLELETVANYYGSREGYLFVLRVV